MSTTHIVQQGEHISQIADKYQYLDYTIIWNDPGNADLKQERESPNVLLPGDQLRIPDHQSKNVPRNTGNVYYFQVPIPKLKLRIMLLDFDDQPMSGLDYELEVEGAKHPGTTGSDGVVEFEIPRTAKKGTLRVESLGLEVPVLIGYLDPEDSDSGWKGRLANLGYWTATDAAGEDSDERLPYALQEFQCDHGIKVTGEADAATQAKLAELHGC